MTSSRYEPNNRRQVYLALSGQIEGQLRDAYVEKNLAGLENQSSLALKLGVNRSVVHKRLMGSRNMTIETIADMVWALGNCIDVHIYDPAEYPSNQPRVVPVHPKAPSAPTARDGKTDNPVTFQFDDPGKTSSGTSLVDGVEFHSLREFAE